MGRVRTLVERFRRLRPLDRSEHAHGQGKPLDNTDGLTAAGAGDIQRDGEFGGMPPASWVKSYDEGRPRK